MKHAFTLIELLVVISIIALLSSMITFIPDHENPQEQIDTAAAQVASMFKQARKLALETGNNHAVVIHIENSGDSSVFKNFSQTYEGVPFGRHWIAVIGPDTGFLTNSKKDPPIPHAYPHLQSYERSVNLCMLNRAYLPPGTRFLAIADQDFGNGSGETGYSTGDKGPGHPRPWFGFYDETENRLYPWGAYAPDVDDTYRSSHSNIRSCTTGLNYEGGDGEIPYDVALDTCVNPDPTHGILFPHANMRHPGASGTVDSGQDPDNTVVGKPRAILDGNRFDYAWVFTGNGELRTYAQTRRRFFEPQWHGSRWRDKFEITHSINHTGGFYITVARDIDPEEEIYNELNTKSSQPDYTKFNSVEDAFKSITPFKRIFVHKDTGATVVRDEFHPDCYLEAKHMLQKDPYPTKEIPEF